MLNVLRCEPSHLTGGGTLRVVVAIPPDVTVPDRWAVEVEDPRGTICARDELAGRRDLRIRVPAATEPGCYHARVVGPDGETLESEFAIVMPAASARDYSALSHALEMRFRASLAMQRKQLATAHGLLRAAVELYGVAQRRDLALRAQQDLAELETAHPTLRPVVPRSTSQDDLYNGVPIPTITEMIDAGVHFGHRTSHWNPKMRPYIAAARNRLHLIDLIKTRRLLRRALAFVHRVSAGGADVLLVGTKVAAASVIEEHGRRSTMPYVSRRWRGGLLTNFKTTRDTFERIAELRRMQQEEAYSSSRQRKIDKLEHHTEGIRAMKCLPAAVFIVDISKEKTALAEATRLGIPTIAMVDTNCNPERVSYAVPANDDSVRSIQMVTRCIADAALRGRAEFQLTLLRSSRMEVRRTEPPRETEEGGLRGQT